MELSLTPDQASQERPRQGLCICTGSAAGDDAGCDAWSCPSWRDAGHPSSGRYWLAHLMRLPEDKTGLSSPSTMRVDFTGRGIPVNLKVNVSTNQVRPSDLYRSMVSTALQILSPPCIPWLWLLYCLDEMHNLSCVSARIERLRIWWNFPTSIRMCYVSHALDGIRLCLYKLN
jgi:hypothetical protein